MLKMVVMISSYTMLNYKIVIYLLTNYKTVNALLQSNKDCVINKINLIILLVYII